MHVDINLEALPAWQNRGGRIECKILTAHAEGGTEATVSLAV